MSWLATGAALLALLLVAALAVPARLAIAPTPACPIVASASTPPLLPVDQPPVPSVAPLTLTGIATWYDAERHGMSSWYTRKGIEFYGAAGPELRALVSHRYLGRYRVLVTAKQTGRAVLVWVVDWCSCHGAGRERLIDLAPSVWTALDMPLSRGIMSVTVEVLD